MVWRYHMTNKVIINKSEIAISSTPTHNVMRMTMGGVGVFNMARSPHMGVMCSPWAIKKLWRGNENKEHSQRLKKEAEILRKLHHPNIVGYRAFLQTNDGRDCLAMEKCSMCLGNMIEERQEGVAGPYPAADILTVAAGLARALDYLHRDQLLLHGDVKSYNVLIQGTWFFNFHPTEIRTSISPSSAVELNTTCALANYATEAGLLCVPIPLSFTLVHSKGERCVCYVSPGDFEAVKLCDFGVSLSLDGNGIVVEGSDMTYVGTDLWSAPEVLDGDLVTSKADLFSYGLVLWEMIALTVPNFSFDQSLVFSGSKADDVQNKNPNKIDNNLEDSTEKPNYSGLLDVSSQDVSLHDICGSRPPLPDVSLGADYNPVLYLFEWCTEHDPNRRPKAQEVLDWLESPNNPNMK
uniref:Protein kinase domain-containing protein n=2 Tax=Timema TaxID=61471 RepID=A0A7R9FGW2_9NEOP|nr:unnamed protein product [Timema bartmani]CAD7453403.1 unnamed protein product [Timema tahoe]